ncbi:MAG: hypothetical protein N3A66_10575 [Planctomycetota bacterium]|nr:hypothetical protein [Planctomycetota bacterium]
MDEGKDLLQFLNESTEEHLASFIKGKVQTRLKELEERKRRLNEEIAAIDYEMDLLKKYCEGAVSEPSVQDLLAKLLKK